MKQNVIYKSNLRREGFGQLHPLQLEIDELAGNGELVEIHPPIPVHIGQAPAQTAGR